MIGPTAAIALAMRDAGIEDADGRAASVLDSLTRNNWRVIGPDDYRVRQGTCRFEHHAECFDDQARTGRPGCVVHGSH